jgi:hypothetical protein
MEVQACSGIKATFWIVFLHQHLLQHYFSRYRLIPWSRDLLQNLTVMQLVNKSSTFYGTQRFITMFTTAHHWSLSWARCIQSTPFSPVSHQRSILTLSSHVCLGVSSGLFLSVIQTNIVYVFLISSMRAACNTHLILDLITVIIPWCTKLIRKYSNCYVKIINSCIWKCHGPSSKDQPHSQYNFLFYSYTLQTNA